MKSAADLKILEIGQFCLLKRNLPAQTTMIFTGQDRAQAAGVDCQIFNLGLLPELRRGLARGEWDLVLCHVPVRPLWDRKHGLTAAVVDFARRMRHVRTFGTYALRGPLASPLVLLDFNDEPNIPAHIFPLLDRAALYFKRELPVDPAKAFLDAARELRTHPEVMASPFVRRNLGKLRPISAVIPEETARLALATRPAKEVDIFFAGSVHSTQRADGLPVLRALQAQGYTVDICEGGLSMRDYLARCARAWLTWSPEGYGWECLRHHEASLCLSVPILSPPGIARYFPLLDGEHAFYYAVEGNGLHETIVRALADKPALEIMAQAARAHALRHHTHARAIEHILETARAAIETRQAAGDPAPGHRSP